jgi:hypothetical protein
MSTQAKSLLQSRIVVALLAVTMVFSFFASAATPKASAVQQCGWYLRVRYFTDASLTTQCGVTVWSCDGETGHGGCWTSYTKMEDCECFEE